MIKLNLNVEAEKLANKVNSKAILDDKFQLEYKIANITEDTLLEEGYKFIGNSNHYEYPMYQKDNLYAMFRGNTLMLGEAQLISEDELNKLNEE